VVLHEKHSSDYIPRGFNKCLSLNTGQYYIITLNDTENCDGDIETTVILMFHDEQHRRVAPSFWKFWLGQQLSTSSARAIDIGKLCQKS
jgi:hypothetical protein